MNREPEFILRAEEAARGYKQRWERIQRRSTMEAFWNWPIEHRIAGIPSPGPIPAEYRDKYVSVHPIHPVTDTYVHGDLDYDKLMKRAFARFNEVWTLTGGKPMKFERKVDNWKFKLRIWLIKKGII